MGGLRLRRLLTVGLTVVLFLSLFTSALGVATLVKKYLWQRSHDESSAVVRNVQRFLERRPRGPVLQRAERRRRNLGRALRRFSRGPGQLLLLRDGVVIKGDDGPEESWAGVAPSLKPGFHIVQYAGKDWLALTKAVDSPLADQVALIRPWTPSLKLVRNLIAYQILVSILVFLLALGFVAYFANRLAKPLEDLTEKSKLIGEEKVDFTEGSRVIEIAELQTAFKDMSERVEESMISQRRFVADASHELKTPLTAMAGMLELLHSRGDMEPKDREQALEVARLEGKRMQSLIDDLLLLSRAQAKRSGKKSSVLLRDLIQEQIQILSLLFPEQAFELKEGPDLKFSINPFAFSRVARNLLENAARYGGGEPVTVTLQKEENFLRFCVSDQGEGIPEEKQAQLFERFYRTDSGRARSAGGHGLGLSIVKALVEEAGGSICCHSKSGQGTKFSVSFKVPE